MLTFFLLMSRVFRKNVRGKKIPKKPGYGVNFKRDHFSWVVFGIHKIPSVNSRLYYCQRFDWRFLLGVAKAWSISRGTTRVGWAEKIDVIGTEPTKNFSVNLRYTKNWSILTVEKCHINLNASISRMKQKFLLKNSLQEFWFLVLMLIFSSYRQVHSFSLSLRSALQLSR